MSIAAGQEDAGASVDPAGGVGAADPAGSAGADAAADLTAVGAASAGRDLAGKVALVVGGTQHMGLAIADEIARRGAAVAVSYSRDDQAATAAVKQLEAHGVPVRSLQADATRSADATRLFDHVVDELGPLDLVVHVPGMILRKPVADFTDDEFDAMLAANARSAFLTLREAGRRVSDGGRIVVLSTTLTATGQALYGVYAGAKAVAEQMVRSLAKEIAPRGVTVNVVAPGPVDTPFFHGQETAESQAFVVDVFTPMHRLGRPSDIAPVVGFLLSDQAGWITGQIVRPNGGMF